MKKDVAISIPSMQIPMATISSLTHLAKSIINLFCEVIIT